MSFDVAVVGAGAAGLASAIFAARAGSRVIAFDGARRLGAKILLCGGGRCNVSNTTVTEKDFFGGNRNLVRGVLQAFSAQDAADFFREIGVLLREEDEGKLFPVSGSAATVLSALVAEADARGVRVVTGSRVTAVETAGNGFRVSTSLGGVVEARAVVLATGGLALPKSGSDGTGYALAQALGHSIVAPTPALVPLVLEGDFHRPLRGVSHPVELDLQVEGTGRMRLAGPMLWTHFGVSGPVILNASRTWHRAVLEGRKILVTVNLSGGRSFEVIERELLEAASASPHLTLRSALARVVPAAVADALAGALGVDPAVTLGRATRELRRQVVHAIVASRLRITGSRGYECAEVTAGGVALTEVHVGRMESRRCPGLFLAGEILDVDGRIGGFNLQWAWSTGHVAGRAAARP